MFVRFEILIDPGCLRYHRDGEVDSAGEECRLAIPKFSVEYARYQYLPSKEES
jgi:hypothetical protein